MARLARVLPAAFAVLASCAALAQATSTLSVGGLVRAKVRNFDQVYVLPGTDFRPYRKVALRKADVTFQRDWLREAGSRGAAGLAGRVTRSEAAGILEAARAGFDEAWEQAFTSAGYEVVAAPGEDVLELRPSVVDLCVNAPEARSAGASRSYTVEAGEATLNLEIRDSRSGALLGRVHDRRETARSPQLQWTAGTTNAREFDRLFATWAAIAVRGLDALKAVSPAPAAALPSPAPLPR